MSADTLQRAVPSPRPGRELRRAFADFLLRYGMILAIVALLVFFSAVNRNFMTLGNMLDVLRAVSILAIVAIGLTVTVVVGGIDASVGATTGLAVMLATALMVIWRAQWWLAILISFAAGAVVGLINAFLVIRLRIPDLLATLSTLYVVSGVQLTITRGDAVYRGMTNPYSPERALTTGEIQPEFLWLGQGMLFGTGDFRGIPVPVVLMLIVAVGFYLFLGHTRHGRLLYAVGGNPEATRLAGVNVDAYRLTAYLISALLATLGGLVLAARIGTGGIRAGDPYLLDAVAATYFGFAVLGARKANVFGTVLGAIFVGVMLNGLTMMNMPWYLQDVVKGAVLMASLGLSFYLKPKST
ncbi:MAG: ABC transporter permease [Anaerolineae bacterium]|nr:ABC transporter permease [Thermoflexales bacterium]MDW8396054.1 ABC transporter permease [Anaerolineae bacterium]